MKHSFKQVNKKKENNLMIFYYEADDGMFKVEIDEVLIDNKIQYVIAHCSISCWMNILTIRAKTKKTLLDRLESLFNTY